MWTLLQCPRQNRMFPECNRISGFGVWGERFVDLKSLQKIEKKKLHTFIMGKTTIKIQKVLEIWIKND